MLSDRYTAAPQLTVIVPAWNEANRIADCLEQLEESLGHLHPEIIVVDDGSRDATAEVAQHWIDTHLACDAHVLVRPHRGKGQAVYAGVRRSSGVDVAFIDADLDIPAEEILHLLRERTAAQAPVVVGSKRQLSWRELPGPPLRRTMSITFSAVVTHLFDLPVRDTQTGIKLFPGPWLRAMADQARVPGFLFDLELLIAAAAQGMRIIEVPVRVTMRRDANRIGVRHVALCALELVELMVAPPREPVSVAHRPLATAHSAHHKGGSSMHHAHGLRS